jgi:hypothetical protein
MTNEPDPNGRWGYKWVLNPAWVAYYSSEFKDLYGKRSADEAAMLTYSYKGL